MEVCEAYCVDVDALLAAREGLQQSTLKPQEAKALQSFKDCSCTIHGNTAITITSEKGRTLLTADIATRSWLHHRMN